jgi:glycolate oxidase iron-sulfur subunit
MQTNFTPEQLADPDMRESEKNIRKCVHVGFCLATCPTYVLLGDELDSPRGRIYLMKDMLENNRQPTPEVVKHIDRCLSDLACVTTCPSGVNYGHLVDHARAYIEKNYRRPLPDRLERKMLATVLPRPWLFRLSLVGATLGRPFARFMPARLRNMLSLAPKGLHSPSPVDRPQVHRARGERRMRVALLTSCAQQVLAPQINEATVRLLTRLGCDVVVPKGMGCCGALQHHMGLEAEALPFMRRNVAAWTREMEGEGLDAVVINASGCGTTVKDYGHILRTDPEWAEKAAKVGAIARDVSEVLLDLGVEPTEEEHKGLRVAYHSACSMQHGQRIREQPKALLRAAGFTVLDVPEGHLCCGSAGTYNLLQPEIAEKLKRRKVANIARTNPQVIAAGNIGCMTQIGSGTDTPIVHTVELLDWATGGPRPAALAPEYRAAAAE